MVFRRKDDRAGPFRVDRLEYSFLKHLLYLLRRNLPYCYACKIQLTVYWVYIVGHQLDSISHCLYTAKISI